MILMINDRFYNEQEIRQLIQSQAEQITKLKKMLLQACSDFATLRDNNSAIDCSHFLTMGGCTGCPLDNGSDCKWIYEPEALALIGEIQNEKEILCKGEFKNGRRIIKRYGISV